MVKRNVVGNIPALEEELSWLKPSTKIAIHKPVVHSAVEKIIEHSKPAEPQKHIIAELQNTKSIGRKGHKTNKVYAYADKKLKNIHVSFWFPEILSRKLKENAVLKNMSLSSYISQELINNIDKKIDTAAIKNISKTNKKSQLSLMIPDNILKNLKLEAIKTNISYTDLLIAKLN